MNTVKRKFSGNILALAKVKNTKSKDTFLKIITTKAITNGLKHIRYQYIEHYSIDESEYEVFIEEAEPIDNQEFDLIDEKRNIKKAENMEIVEIKEVIEEDFEVIEE